MKSRYLHDTSDEFGYYNEELYLTPLHIEHNLSGSTITEFALSIENGNLHEIKLLFAKLTRQQKQGIINGLLNYSELTRLECSGLRGLPIDLAKKFNHEHVAIYLEAEKKRFFSYTFGTVVGLFSKKLTSDNCKIISHDLTIKDGLQIACVNKMTSKIAKSEEEKQFKKTIRASR